MTFIRSCPQWRVLRALAFTAGVAILAGCTPPPPDQSDAKLTVTTTQPAGTYQPGDDVAFRATITNTGSKDLGHVVIETKLDANMRGKSIACSPLGLSAAHAGDADCDGYIYMLRLAKGASVTLDIVATVHSASTGTVTNTVLASALEGPAAVAGSSQAAVADLRGGTFQAFASTGQSYALAVDFASASAIFGNGGTDLVLPFTTEFYDETYDLAGGAAFRAPRDLVVGTADLGSGTKPFIAARNFVTTIAALDGRSFNTFDLDTPTGGAAVTRFLTTSFTGSTMQVCADAAPHTIAGCPAASLRQYDLGVAGGVFTGVDATHGDTVNFQVARSDTALVLLRAEATATGRVFQVGLSTNAGPLDATLEGGDTTGRWGTLAITGSTLEERFLQSGSERRYGGGVNPLADAPAGLVASFIGVDTAPVWMAEDAGLAVLLGLPGSSQDGVLQVFVR